MGSVRRCWNSDCHYAMIPLIGNGRHDVAAMMNRNCDGSHPDLAMGSCKNIPVRDGCVFFVFYFYLEAVSLGRSLTSLALPFLTGVVGVESTWCASRVPSSTVILLRASARVAFRQTSSSPCSRTRLSKSATRTTTP